MHIKILTVNRAFTPFSVILTPFPMYKTNEGSVSAIIFTTSLFRVQ